MDRKTIKQNAKAMVKGNKMQYFLLTLAGGGISFVVTFLITFIGTLIGNLLELDIITTVFSLVGTIASMLLTAGLNMSLYYAAINIYDMGSCDVSDVTYGYRNLKLAWGVYWRQALFTYLWSLLFIIPGIIKMFSYSQAMYIAIDNPDMTAKECMKKSIEMMNGHKFEYFIMGLSFYGWTLLLVPTLGIISVWLIPYMQASYAGFYRDLVNKENASYPTQQMDYTQMPDNGGLPNVRVDY